MDAANAGGRQAEELGKGVAEGEDALGVGPDGEAALGEEGDRAGGADRAVHLVGARVAGGEAFDGRGRGIGPGEDGNVAGGERADEGGDLGNSFGSVAVSCHWAEAASARIAWIAWNSRVAATAR